MSAAASHPAHAPSFYAATARGDTPRPRLQGAHKADVCVIGGGFTGISAALHLAERGYSVILLEAQRLGWGASGRNGGQLHTGQRRDQEWLEKHCGLDQAQRFWTLAQEAVELVKHRIEKHAIDCDWTPGLIHAVHKQDWLADEIAATEKLARDYGYDQISLLDRDALARAIGTDIYFGGYKDHAGGHLHPLNFALGMARAAEEVGARLYEASPVVSISDEHPLVVRTDEGEVTAETVVLGANAYLAGLEPATESRVMPINNFILTTEPLGDARADALIPGREAVADSRFVVHYWRLTRDGRMLFGGGENYSPNFPADIGAFVRNHMLKIYPQLADARIEHAWGGAVAVTANRMPYFRRPRKGLYVACGYSGHGVATANFAGRVIAEAVAGDSERFDVFEKLPMMPFPGGKLLRWPILVLAMTWFALRDRL